MEKYEAFKKEGKRVFIFWQTIFPIFCILLFANIRMQAQVNVIGEIKSQDGQPVPFANILFLQPVDSSLVAGGMTNEEGKFMLDIHPAPYLLNVSMLGYNPFFSSIDVSDSQKQFTLTPISLSENAHELGEVVVNGKRPVFEKEADRTIINVQNSITSAGNTVLEVLEKSPGVTVNRQNGSIALNGKDGVLVMINNKMNRLPLDAVVQMLDGMSAANIGKIELITNPPPKFDAEGNAGIIHIVTKENIDLGTNGTLGLTLGYSVAEILGVNLNFNHRNKRFNYFVNYSVRRTNPDNISLIETYKKVNGFEQIDIDTSYRFPQVTVQNLYGGIEFKLTEKTDLSLLGTGYKKTFDMQATGSNFNVLAPDSAFYTKIDIDKNTDVWISGGIGSNLKHDFSKQQKLEFALDYLFYQNNNPSEYKYVKQQIGREGTETEYITSDKETPVWFFISNIDYSNKLNGQLMFEVGLKGSFSQFTNQVWVEKGTRDARISDPHFTSISSLNEKIFASYFMLKWQPNAKWNFNGGLRYEYMDSHLGSPGGSSVLHNEYGSWFPTLLLTRNLNEFNKIHFSYSKRINRPNYNQIAPYVFFFGKNTFVSGNLSLQPSINHSVEFNYKRKNWWVTFFYNYIANQIFTYQGEIDSASNALVFRSLNFKYNRNFGLNFNFSFRLTSWFRTHNYISVANVKLETGDTGNNLSNHINRFLFNTTNTFKITERFSAEVTGNYQSPDILGLSKLHPTGQLHTGIQQKFKNDDVLIITVNDIFNTRQWKLETNRENFRSVWDYQYISNRTVSITYRHLIGNKKLKTVNIKTGAEAERNRVQ